jgi:hypothetical protein
MANKENMIRFLNGYSLQELRLELKRQNYIVITDNDFKKIINSLTPEFFYGLTEDMIKDGLKRIGIRNFDELSQDQLISSIITEGAIEDSITTFGNVGDATGIEALITEFFINADNASHSEINNLITLFYKAIENEVDSSLVYDDDNIVGVVIGDNILTINS